MIRQATLVSAVTALRRGAGVGARGTGAAGGAIAMSSSCRVGRTHGRGACDGASSFVTTPRLHSRIHPRTRPGHRAAVRSSAYASTRRHLSSGADNASELSTTNKTGDRNGLIRHEIHAEDGHPLRIYSRAPRNTHNLSGSASDTLVAAPAAGEKQHQRSILLLHGRTWSSQPVFDLRTSDDDAKQQSTLQSLSDLGFNVYALDFRGFGETPRDDEGAGAGYTTPRRCVADVKCAIDWITERHYVETAEEDDSHMNNTGFESPTVINTRPALLGWSQGALVAQMYAQQHGPSTLSDLVLFGSIFDPKVIYPRKPLYDPTGRLVWSNEYKPPAPEITNTDLASLEDFTLPGTICDEAALTFSSLALKVDLVKAAWDELHEFNVCNPALIHVPTLVMVGAQDPYVSWEAQRELFERLGTEDRAMCVLPGCDHAAHILKARKMFVRGVAGFLLRKDEF